MIHTVNDFYNKTAADIKGQYFPNEPLYSDNENYHASKYQIELFNNGCLTYRKLIGRLAKYCKDNTANIHAIVEKYIVSFGQYQYKPKSIKSLTTNTNEKRNSSNNTYSSISVTYLYE